MPCTTILVGSKASYDGSTMIARTDDGGFDVKKLTLVKPSQQKRKYKSVIGHLEIELPDNPLPYTACPNVDLKDGLWAATGINAENVGMTATETITTNARVLGADPLVRYKKAEKRGEKDVPGGIGEEDLVVLVLPYIRSAREGVERLGALLEQYGTYESNGIAFNDANEIWWLETIGGHHWIARRVPDEAVVIMPNQFGMDEFDFAMANKPGSAYMCSGDLEEFARKNALILNPLEEKIDIRAAFGSHSDADHIYNTPRAWFMGRYLCPEQYKWDGENADFTPTSDRIPWCLVPSRRVTVEDVKYLLSSHYQGTPYDPYGKDGDPRRHLYRPIGKNNTGVMTVNQIRGYLPKAIQAVEWLCFCSTTFDALTPLYTQTDAVPAYYERVSMNASTDAFYWCSRMLGALADPHYGPCAIHIERYQNQMAAEAHRLLNEWDEKYLSDPQSFDPVKANQEIADMAKKETQKALNNVLNEATRRMTNGFTRGDN